MRCVVIVDEPERVRAFRRLEGVATASSVPPSPPDIVVNWAARQELPGVGDGDSPDAPLVLNRPSAISLASSPSTRRMLWSLAGLRPGLRGRGTWFRAYVFDLRVVRLVQVRRFRGRRILRPLRAGGSRTLEEIASAAVRAVYALRLDFGVVDLIWRSGKACPFGFHPAPSLRGTLGRAFAGHLHRFLKRWDSRDLPFSLGADPEFLIMDRRRMRLVAASRFLPRWGPVGVDSQRLRGSREDRPIAEVRPRPADHPARLVQEMRGLLRRTPPGLRRRGLGWFAGSAPVHTYPIGGHVHLSGLPLTGSLLRSMDAYMALPFLLIEDPSRSRRRRKRYGYLGEFRRKRWGFEYRTPSSWLVAPRFALAALTLARLIGRNWRELRRDPFLDANVTRAFYQCRKEEIYDHFETLWEDLRRLPDFREHQEAISVLHSLIRSKLRWKEERDFRREWGVS